MGAPTVPAVTITRAQAITLLLASIGAENLALAHILNAEGEKIQDAIAAFPATINVTQLIAVDTSVNAILRNIIKKEIILEFELEEISALLDEGEEAAATTVCC